MEAKVFSEDGVEIEINLTTLRQQPAECLATLRGYVETLQATGRISTREYRECDIDGLRLRIETALHANPLACSEEIAFIVAETLHHDFQNHSIRVAQEAGRLFIREDLAA